MFYKLLTILQVDSNEINPPIEVSRARHVRGGFYVAVATGLIVAAGSFFCLHQLISQDKWTKVDGSLMKAEITNGKTPALKITYRYNAGGKTITAAEVQSVNVVRSEMKTIEKPDISDAEVLQATKSYLEQGSKFSVYYNPSAPIESRLTKADPRQAISYLGLIVVSIGLIMAFLLRLIGANSSANSVAVDILHNQAHSEQLAAENNRRKNQEILSALSQKKFAGENQTDATAPPVVPGDNFVADTNNDGAVINIKQSEKETL